MSFSQLATTGMLPDVEALIYLRQSLDRTGEGLAVARQREACEQLCKARGWKIAAIYEDNDTSASDKATRPGFNEMIAHASRDVTRFACVAYAMDRLTRNFTDLARLFDEKIWCVTVADGLDSSTDTGQMIMGISASVARGEIKRKGTRQVLSNQQKARNGVRNAAHRAFGWNEDKTTINPVEASAIREACRVILAGGSLNSVTREWDRQGYLTPQGGTTWRMQSVRKILTNPALCGHRAYRGAVLCEAGQWEPIVSVEIYQAVRAVLTDPTRKPPKGIRSLGGSLYTCVCGNITESAPNSRGTAGYRCKLLTRKGEGPHIHTGLARQIDEYVSEATVKLLASPRAAFLYDSPDVDIAGIVEEKKAITERLGELAGDIALGTLSRTVFLKAQERASVRLAELDDELSQASRGNALEGLLGLSKATWEDLDLSRKRAVVRILWDVVLIPARSSRPKVADIVRLTPKQG